jgi:anti-sigma B factor antagonist
MDCPQEPTVTTEAFSPHGSCVRIAGELDLAYAARLEEAIDGEISRGHRHLVIDLSAATFLDCASIGSLLRAVAPLRHEPDAAIVLAGATGVVKRLLDLLHLDRVFDILPNLDHATEHATTNDRQHVGGWRLADVNVTPGVSSDRIEAATSRHPLEEQHS